MEGSKSSKNRGIGQKTGSYIGEILEHFHLRRDVHLHINK